MRMKRIFFCLSLLIVFFINISSCSVALPFNEKQTPAPINIIPLRGEPGAYLKSDGPFFEIPSKINIHSVGNVLNQAPIKYAIIDGVIDDVDINTSNVDSSDDIGVELNFPNAQGTAIDSQYMQLQEVAGESPSIQIDSISSFSGYGSDSYNLNHTVSGINRLLLIFIQTDSGTNVTSVTFGAQPVYLLIRNESFIKVPAGPSLEVWQLLNPNIGFNNGTITLEGVEDVSIEVVSYTGVDQDIPIDGVRSVTGKSFDTSISIVSRPGDLAHDTMTSSATGIPVEAAGQTRRWASQIGITGRYGVGSTKPGASSVMFNWTTPGDKDWVQAAFNIRKASAPYHLDLEYQWTSAEHTRLEEEIAIHSGDLGDENLSVEVWSGSQWIEIIQDLKSNDWTNVSVTDYLENSNFTIRLRSEDEVDDPSADIWNIDLILLVVSVENTPPSVSNITFSPDPVRSNDTLTLNYNYSDLNGDLESGTLIKWYLLNDSTSDWGQKFAEDLSKVTVSSIHLFKDDKWKVEITPKDGVDFGNKSSQNVTIQNTPPIASNLKLKDQYIPKTEDDLILDYDWFDIDSVDMEIDSIIRWYRNREGAFVFLPQYANSTIFPLNETVKGDIIYFNVTPNDGYNLGISVISSFITIQNTPPILNIYVKNDTGWIPEGIPINFNDTTDLEVNYTANDADYDFLNSTTLEISWLLFNPSLSKFEWKVNDTKILGSGNTTQDDLWIVKMRISDGNNYSEWKSRSLTIGETPNQVPSALNVNLSDASNPIAGGFLNATYDFFDPDGDDPGLLPCYEWYKWNGSDWVFQSQFGIYTKTLTTAQLNKGDIWRVKVKPQDNNTDYGDWAISSNITIINSAPYVVSAEIYPSSNVYTNQILIANFLGDDNDNDQITAFSIVWNNGTNEIHNLNNKTEVPASYTKKGQIWYYTVKVWDGEQWSTNFTLPFPIWITIQNSAPHIENVTLTGGQTTEDSILLDYDFIDVDGDSESTIDTTITWKVFHIDDFVDDLPTTKSLPFSLFTAGDIIYCLIIPSDGDFGGDGSLVDSSNFPGGFIVVGNSPPELTTNPNILSSDNSTSFTVALDLKVNYSITDPDQGEGLDIYGTSSDSNGYVIGSKYRWYRNSELITGLQGPTVDKSYLLKGDRWKVGVQPLDRYGAYGQWRYSDEITINNSMMEVNNLWFADSNTGNILSKETDRNITISLFFSGRDPDIYDTLQDVEIRWYQNTGNGSFLFRSDFTNLTLGPSTELERGHQWYASIRVSDGELWSSYRNTLVLEIVNSFPVITFSGFIFENDSSIVGRTNEFYVEGEDIVLIYLFEDFDSDSNYTLIQWFRQQGNGPWIEMIEFENFTVISKSSITIGDRFYAYIKPFDGIHTGEPVNSTSIHVISRPDISEPAREADLSMDGRYNFTVKITDVSNPENLAVIFEIITINSTFSRNGSYLGSNYWNLIEDLNNWIDTNVKVNIQAYSTIDQIIRIFNYSTFDFTIKDEAPPRVTKISYIWDNDINPTYFDFFITVEEFGSEIKEVRLFYNFSEVDSSSTGFSSRFNEESSIVMESINNTNGIAYYYAKLAIPNFDHDVYLSYNVQTEDQLGNKIRFSSFEKIRLRNNPPGLPPGVLLTVIVILTVIFLAIGAGYLLYGRKSEEKKSKIAIVNDKLAFLSDTYMILIASSAGVPIWSISNISFSTDSSLEGTLSGLSVGIDSFLESFQSDFLSTMTEYDLSKDHPDRESTFRLSVIEQNKIQIMILGSASYRVFVFLQEVPSTLLREKFLTVIKELEHRLPIHDLGYINENILAPNVRMIIKRHLPIGLLTPFKVDIERLNELDSLQKQRLQDVYITKGGIDAIKLLLMAARSAEVANKNASALLKQYNKADFPEKYSGIFLFTDGKQLLTRIPNLSIEDICDAFWMGNSEKVKILIPV